MSKKNVDIKFNYTYGRKPKVTNTHKQIDHNLQEVAIIYGIPQLYATETKYDNPHYQKSNQKTQATYSPLGRSLPKLILGFYFRPKYDFGFYINMYFENVHIRIRIQFNYFERRFRMKF